TPYQSRSKNYPCTSNRAGQPHADVVTTQKNDTHTANSVDAWSALTVVYSTVYWLAARHRWMDIAELAVTRQRWAGEPQPNPLAVSVVARDRAGTYLNFENVERGLVAVDRAITAVEASPLGTVDRDPAVGILNLRGMPFAGRLHDKKEASGRLSDTSSPPGAPPTPSSAAMWPRTGWLSGRRTRSPTSSPPRSVWAGRASRCR
ncbi:hypothetical protein ACFU9Y_30865, partial [Streptomyces sp. NPDC057621]